MKVAKAWFWLSLMASSAWLAIIILVYFLEMLLSAFRDPLLRALLGLVLFLAWLVFMALSVEVVRARIGSRNLLPEKRA